MNHFICNVCSRDFSSIHALNGHKGAKHAVRSGADIIAAKRNAAVRLKHNQEKYYVNPHLCLHCSSVIAYEHRYNKFCNHICSATYNNRIRGKHSEETKKKIRETLKRNHGVTESRKEFRRRRWIEQGIDPDKRIKKKRKTNVELKEQKAIKPIKSSNCNNCGVILPLDRRHLKTCSVQCQRDIYSKVAIKRILTLGTSNSSTKIKGFTYKNITVDCDSKLEAAAIITLSEMTQINRLDRFRSILTFYDNDGKKHRFNPDFIADIEGQTVVIEVKQVYKKSIRINDYNRFFEEKKTAIAEFCEKRGYEWLWLDFDTFPEMKRTYRKIDFYLEKNKASGPGSAPGYPI